ncbi:DUF5330 domain-containing protein [Roseibium litorale]|uniref:DUF5330 domain-containing protein n=1 Tax=Roseibium litorale TaxID=2803841 RepID=A0ABR9CT03_9HYPH|nr:DUF5330 domain-containing protein [Roseibium litorale]MBD8893530.1 DUF5330 domain-containing protein [Roseibium litorale]
MFFLLRTAFWLTLVLALIPIGSGGSDSETKSIDPVAAYFAAQAAVSDLSGFCDRNPAACETGSEAISAIGARARDGARIVYEYLDTQVADEKSGTGQGFSDQPGLVTGSIPEQVIEVHGSKEAAPKGGTLTEQDLTLPWKAAKSAKVRTETPIGPLPRPNPRAG